MDIYGLCDVFIPLFAINCSACLLVVFPFATEVYDLFQCREKLVEARFYC